MIEEYISRLQEESKEKLSSYDKEMQDLTQELSVTEKLLSQLQKEKQDDKNIFSPRTLDSGRDQEIQEAEDQVRNLKQRLEYVSQMVETEMQNADEYRRLAQEAAKESAKEVFSEKDASKGIEEKESAQKTDDTNSPKEAQKESQEKQEFVGFLNSVYKKVEFSLSLINGNKNRCRSELKKIEQMIRSYEETLNGSENS